MRLAWELGHDPSLRIKVVCASESLAAERGRFLRTTLEENLHVREVFPRLIPARPWTDTHFTVVRPANVIGPTIAAIGIGAASTGSRADLLVCDDIVDVKSIASRSQRKRIKEYFRDNLMNLLEPDGRCWNLFTPWHADDLNNELKQNPEFAHFRRAVSDDLEPVWPERWSRERLEERRREIGSISFARGYRLTPLAVESSLIHADWIRLWQEAMPWERVILSIDPALSISERADASALVLLAKMADNTIRCIEAVARRVATPHLIMLIDEMDQRYHPDVILFEANAAFRGIHDLMVRHAGFGPKIKAITQVKDKATRVAAFSVAVENGTFQLRGRNGVVDPSQQALWDEMTMFPVAEHDDLLDAASTGTKYLLDYREPRIWD